MDSYQIVVITLIILAIADLIVGVSNDAVNFLNSAIGSKVAARNTILLIAAGGVLLGAISSSGMMEIARKGIFNPGVFTFEQVMVIFMAVMVADILLLDFFNTLGLPTSTTVSIVFDLLGASVAVAILKSLSAGSGWGGVEEAINSGQAIAIISGIFLSIGVAFAIGALVQYLSRLLFTFRYDRYLDTYGVVFAGISVTVIVHFLLIKGAKGSTLLETDAAAFMNENIFPILVTIFVIAILLVLFFRKMWGLHPLKFVVFIGTFALAMAFAGNDLVNFIGVPLAGLQSYQIWSGSGLSPDMFMMDQLGAAVQTPVYLLVIAGLIMVVTLWFSGKSRKVTETEVNLGRQGTGEERFEPNFLSRSIVGGALGAGRYISNFFPNATIRRMNLRFDQRTVEIAEDKPAFDLIRASVNLIVASLLIAWATSLKLPLSTTYVSFMVAMGTSLADRAWGRESAVYRVSGVLNVIGGWFVTAIMAFVTAGLVAVAIYFGGTWVAVGFGGLAILVFVASNLRFNRQQKLKERLRDQEYKPEKQEKLFEVMRTDICELLQQEAGILSHAFNYFENKEGKPVKKIKKRWKTFTADSEKLKSSVYKRVLKKSSYSHEYGPPLLFNLDHVKDLEGNLQELVELIKEHKLNHQELPKRRYFKKLSVIRDDYFAYSELVCEKLPEHSTGRDSVYGTKRELQEKIQEELNNIMVEASKKKISYKQAVTITEFLLILKNLVAIKARILRNYHVKDTDDTGAQVLI